MARVPLTEEQVSSGKLILNVEKVALTDDQFLQLCRDNSDFRMELTAQKELVIMPPMGLKGSWRENMLCFRLTEWAVKDGTGVVLNGSAGFRLPDGAILAPDASWFPRERLARYSGEDLEKFGHLCPDFVAEIKSTSDTVSELKSKMSEYIANGAQLGWLIDPFNMRVYLYRPKGSVERLENPTTISGEPVLPGFTFNVSEIW
jgi:Uma2 family endonuclease